MKQTNLILIAGMMAGMALGTELHSPNGQITARVSVGESLSYTVSYRGQPVILASRIGYAPGGAFRADGAPTESVVRSTWTNPFGERLQVHEAYNGVRIPLADGARKLVLECRAYDEGFAFRWILPAAADASAFQMSAEKTEFAFGGDYRCWPVSHAQGHYAPSSLSAVQPGAERPLVVELPTCTVALGEAGLLDFSRMKFARLRGNTLVTKLDGPASVRAPAMLPWRYIRIADNACRLLEGNDLLLNLNEPSKIKDTSWIHPGKVIRCSRISTRSGKACVDFCKKMNLSYIELDAGWYGNERTDDARRPGLDPKHVDPRDPFDLFEILAYAKEQGIRVLLYVNQKELERHLDEILPLYVSWGVAGIKYGFVSVGQQTWTRFLSEAIRKAAEHRLMLDIHDEYRLTGNQRTWPNVLTVEGVCGNEEMPDAAHNCALAFTRYLAGPGDYTPCWTAARVKNTRAHQLALAAVYFSPFQFLYWYDRPEQVKDVPELSFWKTIPTVWEETRALAGTIGDYAVIARRAGSVWYVGAINANVSRTLDIPLDFLKPGITYTAFIARDAAPENTTVHSAVTETRTVTARDTLHLTCAANGGAAIRLSE